MPLRTVAADEVLVTPHHVVDMRLQPIASSIGRIIAPIDPIEFVDSPDTDNSPAARIAANLTQDDLAEILGVGQGFVSDVERGRRELPERHYERLPAPIRAAVVEAAIGELQDRISELRKSLK